MQIFPEDQVDENFFDLYYHPYKKQIWGFGFVLAVVVVTFLGVRQYNRTRLDDQWMRYESAMQIAGPRLPGQTQPEEADEQIDAMRAITLDYPSDPVTPFALKSIVDAQVAAMRYDEALETLDELQKNFPDYLLFTEPATDSSGSLADHLRASIESERKWMEETSYVHEWPDSERIACVDTTMGTLWLGFYEEDAPRHVEAFIQNALSGTYNGTQVYEVRRGTDGSPQLIRGGSAASRDIRDPADHDRDEPGDTIEPEDSRFTIQHVHRVVSAVEMDSGESRTRFQIITDEGGMVERFFGRTTPFAAVLEREGSLDALERIARAQTYGTNPETASSDGMHRMRDHPYPPIYIRRVTILKDELPIEGHTWDTSNHGRDVAEAWEADLPDAPKPEEFVTPPDDGGETDGTAPDDNEAEDADTDSDDSETDESDE